MKGKGTLNVEQLERVPKHSPQRNAAWLSERVAAPRGRTGQNLPCGQLGGAALHPALGEPRADAKAVEIQGVFVKGVFRGSLCRLVYYFTILPECFFQLPK